MLLSRRGTASFRGRSNATLNTMSSLLEPFGMEYQDLIFWMWTPDLQKEFIVLAVEPALEFTRLDSYIQYIIGMSIVSKSPYSATSCPEIYSLMHICGLTQGKPRSKNATLPGSGISDQTVWIGAVMAYALMEGHQHSTMGTITHLSAELQDRVANLEGAREEAARSMRESKGGVNWMCKVGDPETSYKIRKFAAEIWAGLL